MTIMDLNAFFENSVKPPAIVAGEARNALKRYKRQDPGLIVPFGFPPLDDEMSMVAGNLYLVVARPGGGKTAFLKQVCGNAAESLPEEYAIVIFSAEMDAASLTLRDACGREKLSYWKMVKGQLTEEEYARLDRAIVEIGRNGRIYIDDTPAPTLEGMAKALSEVEAVRPVGMIAFDYLQLAGEFDSSEAKRTQKISRGLAALSKRFNCPVLALHQANREAERDEKLSMRHLMSGGEQDASGIIILEPNEDVLNGMNFHIVKHRHGPSNKTVILGWKPESLRFYVPKLVSTDLNTGKETPLPYNKSDD